MKQLKEYRDFNPDILIYQGGENTPPDLAVEKNYPMHVKRLIDYIGAKNTIIISEFWPEPIKYQMINKLAQDNDYIFTDISKLMFVPGAMATKEYGETPVGRHPSDKGMCLIADEVIKYLPKDTR